MTFLASATVELFLWPILAGIVIGVLAPLIGSIIIVRRLSFIADTLSHFSLAGVCLGTLLAQVLTTTVLEDVSPIFMGIVFSIGGTFLIERLRGFYTNYKELSMPIVLSLGTALTGIFLAVSEGAPGSLAMTLLFGSIFTITLSDFILILIMAILIIVFMVVCNKDLISLCFDETFARVSGVKTKSLQLLITIILAVFISVTMQIIGVLLVAALMIVPVAASILIGRSYKSSLVISVVFSVFSVLAGIILSYFWNLPSGSLIVMVNIIILGIILIITTILKKKHTNIGEMMSHLKATKKKNE